MGMGLEESVFFLGRTVNFSWTKKIPQRYLIAEDVFGYIISS